MCVVYCVLEVQYTKLEKYNDSQIFQPSDNNVIDTFLPVIQSSAQLGDTTGSSYFPQHNTPVACLLSPLAIVSTDLANNIQYSVNERIV